YPGQIALGAVEMLDKGGDARRDDRNSHGRLHCGHCRPHSADGRNDLDAIANELGRQARQPSIIAVGPAVLDRQIAAFAIAGLIEPPAIICKEGLHIICGDGAQKAGPVLPLGATSPWQRRKGATSQQKKIAASHSMTSSARARIAGGTVSPNAWAVF